MMRRRLFWKILLGFLVTFLLMTQAVWLLFALRDDREFPEWLVTQQIGPAVLEAATQAVAAGGRAQYDEMASHLPQDQRRRLDIFDASQPVPAPLADDPENAAMERGVTDQAGNPFVVRFRYHRDRQPWRLNVPPELLFIGVIAGLLFSAFLAWYLVRPIEHLRRGFQRLARGELTARVSPAIGSRRDEVADLAREFDRMARRLEKLVESRERLMHDVSHELRSPLARLQLAIALARQAPERFESAMERMEREVDRLDGLVGELLILARVENEENPGDEYFDIAGIAESVVADARYEAQPGGIEISFEPPAAMAEQLPPVRGSSELLRRAIDNIVRNALRFSAPLGHIDVCCTYREQENRFLISVSDEGPGVPSELVDTIFDPFVRGRPDGKNLGLGLAIASRAIAVHGGLITARNLPEGGFRVEIEIPAAL
ncbi:HAMP domain-containing sensor histidine kinase [Novosphingobium sp. RL4]|uniref:HAMP domain-containing sensor histidine kinase n=1 Tax=Novosphingobium sp. RL4 TaxID=3109595 RepID=UPI002D79DC29|nr:ATP-binding protein [Novosphingobium sp. RL4]WRT95493.1 ATP-binding protein [Novosphingobium sp. RL4]